MTTTNDNAGNAAGSLRIEGEMNIYQAVEWKSTVLDALAKATELDIDLSGVSEIDTAGLQVLMLAKKTAQATNKPLRLVRHSQAVIEVLEMLNLAAWFGDPLVMSPTDAS